MAQLIYILFACVAIPLILMLFLLEKRNRETVIFLLLGMVACICAAEINSIVLALTENDTLYTTITYTPIIEELLKGLPVLFCALYISDKRERLLQNSMAVGIGFALLENIVIMSSNIGVASFSFALVRGFASGLVHGICTAMLGYGLSLVQKRRKLAVTGTFGLFITASIYHAIFNALVQSDYRAVAYVMPILTYIPIVIFMILQRKKKQA